MISALDSSVVLDVLTADPTFGTLSEDVLRLAATEGKLIVCECVVAEITPALANEKMVTEFLGDWRIEFVPSSPRSAILGGENFSRYLARGGKGGRVVADFLIAAHAQVHADRLVARDRGFLRDYFAKLRVLDPAQTKS
jgi:predicted nucleic acid-binding protein